MFFFEGDWGGRKPISTSMILELSVVSWFEETTTWLMGQMLVAGAPRSMKKRHQTLLCSPEKSRENE